jgi:hypothetical protein
MGGPSSSGTQDVPEKEGNLIADIIIKFKITSHERLKMLLTL